MEDFQSFLAAQNRFRAIIKQQLRILKAQGKSHVEATETLTRRLNYSTLRGRIGSRFDPEEDEVLHLEAHKGLSRDEAVRALVVKKHFVELRSSGLSPVSAICELSRKIRSDPPDVPVFSSKLSSTRGGSSNHLNKSDIFDKMHSPKAVKRKIEAGRDMSYVEEHKIGMSGLKSNMQSDDSEAGFGLERLAVGSKKMCLENTCQAAPVAPSSSELCRKRASSPQQAIQSAEEKTKRSRV
mmetsp:Transcript_17049/g.24917  ORF Transcript_17049/g.24917 Transcript_17049/m.24917 type:complete len:239 (+) Transcript_17049:78-794(+)|eukprot:CAMPEP_0113944872 /NCGR_PEP_ID=MMETSP1339-20121228/37445_1 /TAXON_ID=94617 /ORGANISM="Fibrocapsa japonica" /LENGTH=238 /DNA_ID=CAMNT_0000950213 /DNA_START=78 /DNA_END=794 /DNA_ORIENTATION=+ /assembly_acc=CAM_ASM_000762